MVLWATRKRPRRTINRGGCFAGFDVWSAIAWNQHKFIPKKKKRNPFRGNSWRRRRSEIACGGGGGGWRGRGWANAGGIKGKRNFSIFRENWGIVLTSETLNTREYRFQRNIRDVRRAGIRWSVDQESWHNKWSWPGNWALSVNKNESTWPN